MAEQVGKDRDVHAMALASARVERGVGDPVDRQQSAVQDHERPGPRDAHHLEQGRREHGQQVDGFAYAAVRGRDADPAPGGKLGVGVTTPQRGQGEEALTVGGQRPPPGPGLPSPQSESCGLVPRGATGQVDRQRVDKQAKLLADG